MRCTACERTTARRKLMKNTTKRGLDTRQLVLLAVLTAIVAVLAYFGGFIKIGGLASISLTLIPVVIGGALCGPLAGAWLGAVSGAVFFLTADAAFWVGLSLPGTVITVMVKGILAGYCAALCFKLLEKVNRYLAVLVSAIVCPVVNTGIFLIGCMIFFKDTVDSLATSAGYPIGTYLILFFVGLNFVFELLTNIILSPTIVRLLDIQKKISTKKA